MGFTCIKVLIEYTVEDKRYLHIGAQMGWSDLTRPDPAYLTIAHWAMISICLVLIVHGSGYLVTNLFSFGALVQ